VKSNAPLLLTLTACWVAPACGGTASSTQAPIVAQRDVAQRFAEAIFRGNSRTASALLLNPEDAELSSIVTDAAVPWKARHGKIRFPGQRSGERWIFGFVGTHAHNDGRFERVRGRILVVVNASSKRAGVSYFLVRNDEIRFSTHHDSVLLPSNR
jgi:hypothetical protein